MGGVTPSASVSCGSTCAVSASRRPRSGRTRCRATSSSCSNGLELGPATLIGVSLGGAIALETAIARPELVSRLVLVAPGLRGFEMSDETKAGWAEEEAALERGDVDGAVEVNLRMWVDGPSRAPDEVDADVRSKVGEMQRRAIEIWLEAGEERRPPGAGRGLGRSARRDLGSRRSSSSGTSTGPRCSRSRNGSRPRFRTRAGRRSPAPRTSRAWSARTSSTGSCWISSRELSGSDELVERIWAHDPTVWTGTDEAQWLGWLDEPSRMLERIDELDGAPGGLRAGRPARDGRLEPRARGDAPHVRRQRSPRARHDASERDPAPRGGARPRPHAVRRRVEVRDDARDALAARLLPRPRRRRVRRDHGSRQRPRDSSPTSTTSSGSSTASRRSAGATRRCRRSGSSRPC